MGSHGGYEENVREWGRIRTGTLLVLSLALVVSAAAGQGSGPQDPKAAVGKIASLQNQVETKRRAEAGYAPSTLYQALYQLDRVRTGPASRAALLYSDRTLHRIGEKSEIEIQPPSGGQPGLLKVVSGTHYFSSRAPKDYGRIETPTVTAAIKGTEFVVAVAENQATTITMLEGIVEASNSLGTVTVGSGEEAFVEAGKAPTKRIVVRPRDAVAWAIDYPPVLGGADAKRLASAGKAGESLTQAAKLLSAGQVDQAKPLIASARSEAPNEPAGLALASVIATATNEREEGMKLAEQAVAAGPDSAAAALAVSYAAQAQFDIPRARQMAEKAATLDPESSVALARVAELRMAEGDLGGAEEAAAEAVKRAPSEARALSVQGFIELAQYRSWEAERIFERAVAADASSSLARLGLGIARIRMGKVVEGREELQTAVALDPENSLLRSYLGKALYEEKLDDDAAKELTAAKQLDPNDPTPWLYDAIRKQNDNRPVEALHDLRESVRLNDNRAVYRSRLLLDEDRAVRGADLARIYNDLGFEQLGLVTARRSTDENQANYSGHLFLSGNYRQLPGFAPAFFSELLQGRIYQPVSVNAVRPDVVNETVSFNEYTALFDRPRFRAFGGLAGGGTDTDLTSLTVDNSVLNELVSIEGSGFAAGDAIGTLNGDRYALAVSYTKIDDDGFRFNNDRDIDTYRVFSSFALTYRDVVQLSFQRGLQETGDLPLRFQPATFAAERFDNRLWNAAAGYHRIFSPALDFAASFIYNATRQTGSRFLCDPAELPDCVPSEIPGEGSAVLRGPQLEVQGVYRQRWVTWIGGAGAFRGTTDIHVTGFPTVGADDEYTNAYVYATIRPHPIVDVTVGVAGEKVLAPVGILPPRDSLIIPSPIEFDDTKVSPKLGVTVRPTATTTIRAAGYERMSPALGRIQSLEPTQVAGFNQFFREPGGTRSRSFGAGVDQTFGPKFFAGLSYLRRDLDVPEASCDAPNDFTWCAGQVATNVVEKESKNTDAAAYFDYVITRNLTFALEGSFAERDFDTIQVNNDGFLFEDFSETWRIKPGLRFYLPIGIFASASATYYDQTVEEFDDFSSSDRIEKSTQFWLGDLSVGYKLPQRMGSFVLEARNVSDREFEFFDREVEEIFIPARSIVLRFLLTY